MDKNCLLQAQNISITLGGKEILKNVSLNVCEKDIKVIIGPSGAGKSTFLQCLNHLLSPSGSIIFDGKKVDFSSKKELCKLRQDIGMIFQDFNLFDHLSAEDNVALALRKVANFSKQKAHQIALKELDRVGLLDKAKLYPAELSGGQKQRVAIARALAMEPKILLLDEPTSALDPELVGEVIAVIRELAKNGMPMVMATHQMEFARNLATEILFMEEGQIIERGTPSELLSGQTRTYDFCSKLVDIIIEN